jgi:hypothetical protein
LEEEKQVLKEHFSEDGIFSQKQADRLLGRPESFLGACAEVAVHASFILFIAGIA